MDVILRTSGARREEGGGSFLGCWGREREGGARSVGATFFTKTDVP